MSTNRGTTQNSAQAGFTLVELMVSVVIALVLMIALMQLLLGTMQTDRATSDVSRMQESGRNALEAMGRVIRQAGSRNNVDVQFAGTALNGTQGTGSAADTITIQYEAQAGGETNCAGAVIAAGGLMTYAFAINTTANPPMLTCNGTAMVDNIEDMQISYGIDAAKDGNIDSYTTTPTTAQFKEVAAVRIALLVRGPSANIAANKTQTYTFNGASVTKTDGFLRQVFNATFTVRNRAG